MTQGLIQQLETGAAQDVRSQGLHTLADTIRTLGPEHRADGELMQVAVRDRNDNTVTWHLIHVLEKLEKGVA